jgi:hypothetical protein
VQCRTARVTAAEGGRGVEGGGPVAGRGPERPQQQWVREGMVGTVGEVFDCLVCKYHLMDNEAIYL